MESEKKFLPILKVRRRSSGHRPFERRSGRLFASVARIPDPVADEDFAFQKVYFGDPISFRDDDELRGISTGN